MRRRPFVAVLPVIVLVAAALVYGLQRTPGYSAENRLSVAQLDLSQPGALNGFASATEALAGIYSRGLSAEVVIDKVAKQARLTPSEVRSRIFATPIPDSSVFKIQAEGTTPDQAITLVNASASALLDYIITTNEQAKPVTGNLLERYRDAQLKVTRASLAFDDARRAARVADTPSRRDQVVKTRSALASARLRAQTISDEYTRSTGATAVVPDRPFNVLAKATTATSDRSSRLQIALFVAVVGGALLGGALALLVEDQRIRRTLRHAG